MDIYNLEEVIPVFGKGFIIGKPKGSRYERKSRSLDDVRRGRGIRSEPTKAYEKYIVDGKVKLDTPEETAEFISSYYETHGVDDLLTSVVDEVLDKGVFDAVFSRVPAEQVVKITEEIGKRRTPTSLEEAPKTTSTETSTTPPATPDIVDSSASEAAFARKVVTEGMTPENKAIHEAIMMDHRRAKALADEVAKLSEADRAAYDNAMEAAGIKTGESGAASEAGTEGGTKGSAPKTEGSDLDAAPRAGSGISTEGGTEGGTKGSAESGIGTEGSAGSSADVEGGAKSGSPRAGIAVKDGELIIHQDLLNNEGVLDLLGEKGIKIKVDESGNPIVDAEGNVQLEFANVKAPTEDVKAPAEDTTNSEEKTRRAKWREKLGGWSEKYPRLTKAAKYGLPAAIGYGLGALTFGGGDDSYKAKVDEQAKTIQDLQRQLDSVSGTAVQGGQGADGGNVTKLSPETLAYIDSMNRLIDAVLSQRRDTTPNLDDIDREKEWSEALLREERRRNDLLERQLEQYQTTPEPQPRRYSTPIDDELNLRKREFYELSREHPRFRGRRKAALIKRIDDLQELQDIYRSGLPY